ncbi:MAG: MFS transporter [Dehalococcoidales bacterium]|nr:MFS transporter [Dehalococcoidales bacterium]
MSIIKRLQTRTGITGEMTAILVVMGLTTLAMSLLNPVLPLYLTSIDIGPALLGTMLSVAMFGMAIGEAGWGWLADRTGVRLAMITGTFLTGLSVLMFVFTQNVPLIFAIFFIWGFLRSAVFGPIRGYIGTAAPPHKKATFMALSAVMLSASSSLGALPSGFLVDSLGYHSVFYTSLGVSIIGGIIVLTGLKNNKDVSENISDEEKSKDNSPKAKFNLFSLTPMCLVTALRFFGLGCMMTFLPLFATEEAGIDITLVGVLFTIGGLTNVVLTVPTGILADRLGKKNIMIAGMIVSAGAMAGTAYSGNFTWLVVYMIVNSLGMALFSPAALGLLSDSVPRNRQSTAMGFYGGICENVGILTGSALGGVIWDNLGPQSTFFSGAIACGLGSVLCIALVKNVSIKK